MSSDKTNARCPECDTVISIRLSRIPARITNLPCPNCQAAIPLLRRILGSPAGDTPPARPVADASPAPTPEHAYRRATLASPAPADDEDGDDGAWLAVYGDIMSILLIFFILLFAISTLDKRKFETAMNAISLSLGGAGYQMVALDGHGASPAVVAAPAPPPPRPPDDLPRTIDDLQARIRDEQSELRTLRQDLETFIADQGLGDRFGLLEEEEGLALIARDTAMFDAGSAILKETFKAPLREIGRLLLSVPNTVAVEGHTDDTPIAPGGRHASNWELSAARATTVVRFLLEELPFPPGQFSAAGFASFKPRHDHRSAEAYKNRRIEIRIRRRYASDLSREILRLDSTAPETTAPVAPAAPVTGN